jgi:hypothetical protein
MYNIALTNKGEIMLTELEEKMRDALAIARNDLLCRAKSELEYNERLLVKINHLITDADLKEQKKEKV